MLRVDTRFFLSLSFSSLLSVSVSEQVSLSALSSCPPSFRSPFLFTHTFTNIQLMNIPALIHHRLSFIGQLKAHTLPHTPTHWQVVFCCPAGAWRCDCSLNSLSCLSLRVCAHGCHDTIHRDRVPQPSYPPLTPVRQTGDSMFSPPALNVNNMLSVYVSSFLSHLEGG